jgi:hypothetical protein
MRGDRKKTARPDRVLQLAHCVGRRLALYVAEGSRYIIDAGVKAERTR